MKQVSATDFQINTSKMMKFVLDTNNEIVVTKNGIEVMKLVPIKKSKYNFGCMEGTATILGDIMEPIEDVECTGDWENIEPYMNKKDD